MKGKIIMTAITVAVTAMANAGMGAAFAATNEDTTKYCGSGEFVEHSETINYSRKETTEYGIKGNLPNYIGQIENANCANVAGTIIIGYYDRLCEELMPNHTNYLQLGTAFLYKSESAATETVQQQLYSLMGTNVGGAGTTFNGFHNGMSSFVSQQGYSYITEDLGSLNLDKYKSSVESNKPVALFLSDYSFQIEGQNSGSSEVVKSKYCDVAHVAVGYGYKIDTYYNSSNQVITTRTYLKVSSGIFGFGLTNLCLDGKSTIDRATSILIN